MTRSHHTAVLVFVVVVLAFVLALWAGPARGDWREELSYQIEREEGCVVAFYSQVVERVVDGHQVILGKAHCEDGRAFDIARDDVMEPFRISPCGIVEKETAC